MPEQVPHTLYQVSTATALVEGIYQDAVQVAALPFYLAFLHGRPDTFVIGYAVGDGCALATIDKDGNISVGPLVKIDTSAGLPSELCWAAVSPDDRFVFATNFGYSYISTFRVNGKELEIAKDPASVKVPGDGNARGLVSNCMKRQQRLTKSPVASVC